MLFDPFLLGPIPLANRLVMAPMTRNRADADHIPTSIMATYYAQRASMGLIITEGVSPSANGLGYPRMGGIHHEAAAVAWRPVTAAVHAAGGRIALQLMHTGRASHGSNLPAGAVVLGPTDQPLVGDVYSDAEGLQPASTPRAMTEADIATAIEEFVTGARRAIDAGFDAVELHGANGYLLEQFLNANINTRSDAYGGDAERRNRFTLEVARAVTAAIGADRVGIRLSPYGAFNGTGSYEGIDTQFLALATELGAMGLLYLHLVDHESMGAPAIPAGFHERLRAAFGGVFIASGGLDRAKAEAVLAAGQADLVAFGRPALANPDLVARLRADAPLNAADHRTFYTPGEVGYTDYPTLEAAQVG